MREIIDISDNLRKHAWKEYGIRDIGGISSIVVHHSAGSMGFRSIAGYHVNVRDWPGIGYTYGVHHGQAWRLNDIKTKCYNVSRTNSKIIGIVMVGNYEREEPTRENLKALDDIIMNIRNILGPLPVKGHREYKATLCPGKHLMEHIQKYNI